MEHICTFVVHVVRSFSIYIVRPNDRPVVPYFRACSNHIIRASLFAKMIVQEKAFGVCAKSFMYPHIGNILAGNAVSEPFVCRFVYNYKIKFQSPARVAFIGFNIPVFVSVAVSYRTLVFHSWVWDFNKFVAVFVKRIWAKPIFKCFQHPFYFPELEFCFFQIIAQHIIITI